MQVAEVLWPVGADLGRALGGGDLIGVDPPQRHHVEEGPVTFWSEVFSIPSLEIRNLGLQERSTETKRESFPSSMGGGMTVKTTPASIQPQTA